MVKVVFLVLLLQQCRSFRPPFTDVRRVATILHMSDINNNINNSSFSGMNSNSKLTPLRPLENGIRFEFDEPQQNIAKIPTRPEDIEILNSGADLDNSKLTYSNTMLSSSNNKFFQVVEKLAPNELLTKFSKSAPKPVQEAVKSTLMNLLGSLPQYALDAAVVTTNSKLANLMFQMQMTGYMYKNAEYRMSFTKSLKGLPKLIPATKKPELDMLDQQTKELTDSLIKEINELRQELALVRDQREGELRSNILTYVQALPEQDLKKLTSDMSVDVVDAIQLLVDALMERLGIDSTGPEVMVQQTVGALAQLCMWQMVVGYKLREMEAFEKGVALD